MQTCIVLNICLMFLVLWKISTWYKKRISLFFKNKLNVSSIVGSHKYNNKKLIDL